MNRRCKYSVYVKDDAFRRMDEGQKVEIWDFMQMFFPDDTNKKQFEAAHNFMRHLIEGTSIQSENIKKKMTSSEYNNLISIVLPKLERFGLIKVIGERKKGKTYRIELDKKFSDRIRHLGMEWFRVYTRYGDAYGG
jgi:hypothetical protein